MFIDTHAHLVKEPDVAGIISRATDANVGAIVCATAHPDDWVSALDLADRFENVFVTIGIHPEYAEECAKCKAQSAMFNEKVIGIGEIGLDYHYPDGPDRKLQIELFEKWLAVARENNLPVAIHSRDAEADTMAILTEYVAGLPTEALAKVGVLHSFTGSWNMARVMLDRGFYFSANGILTFKNAEDLRDVFAKIPMDRIVIETDSPWLAPVPYRGKPCEPAMVVETARALAALRGLQLDEMEDILETNTKNLYPRLNNDTNTN